MIRGERPGLAAWVRGRAEEMAEALSRAEDAAGSLGAALALDLLDEGRWLRLLMVRAGHGRPEAALQEAGREAAGLAESLDGSDGEAGVRAIRRRLLEHRLEAVEREAAGSTGGADLVGLLVAADGVSDEADRLAGATGTPEAAELVRRTDELEKEIRRRVEAEVRGAPPDRSAELAESLAVLAVEAADEAFVVVADLSPEAAGHTMRRARRRAERVLALWRSLEGRPRMPRPLRRLGRVRRRLRAEEQELGLQARLERIFGRGTVAFVENLILTLILGVVGVLLYEGIGNPSPETRHVLMWVDVGICAIFLGEIGVRLALVPGGRLRWFVRHLPFDVLPSIPFGLLEHALSRLDVARAGRIVRLVRLERLARYVRAVRPFVRLFRVLAFLLRGLDRLVHRNSRLLNRDVLLFTPARARIGAGEAEAELPARLERRSFDVLRLRLEEQAEADRAEGLREAMARTARFVERALDALRGMEPDRHDLRGRSPEIRIEELIDVLARATPSSMERRLGVLLTARLAEKVRWLDLPLLRKLPVVSRFAPGARRLGDGEIVARAARGIGVTIRRVYDRILAASDLSGMISGPQLLDRLGGALARSTGRPARRLLLFGGAFLIAHALSKLTGIAVLERIMTALQRFLGTPLLVIGGVCLVLFTVGVWFRRIAGEATDFLERTAEAQYLNLLKIVKHRRLVRDLRLLQERVLEPERLLLGGVRADPDRLATEAARLSDDVRQVLGATSEDEPPRPWPGIDLSRRQRILGLVHDYLDGATLHQSDQKTTEQLLGNLAIMNLWRGRMRLDRDHRRRLRRLDLSREQGLGGPYLWFNFITRTVAQRTAELLLEYNRQVCPLADRGRLSGDDRAALEAWVERRRSGEVGSHDAGSGDEDGVGRPFRTSYFTALHFLAPLDRLDEAVAQRFGPDVLGALRADRRRLIREVFGTYPLHRLPREKRVLNPFDLYRRHVAGFRVLLLPLTLLVAHLRGAGAFLRRIGQVVREVRRPELVPQARGRGIADFDVAVRKIGRMRGPVFRECAWLRALVDVEYLGLGVPGLAGRSGRDGFEEDLTELPPTRDWQDRFATLREERRRDLRALRRLLERHGVSAESVAALLGAEAPDAAARARILRATCVGFAADDRDCRSLLVAQERIEEAIDEVLADPLAVRRGLVRRGSDLARRGAGLLSERLDPLPAALRRHLRAHPRPLRLGERRRLLRAARSNHRDLGRLLRLGGSAEEAWDRLREVAADHERLDEELVTLRTVQTLAVLDVRQYRDLVHQLGEYGEDGAAAEEAAQRS